MKADDHMWAIMVAYGDTKEDGFAVQGSHRHLISLTTDDPATLIKEAKSQVEKMIRNLLDGR